MSTDLHQSTPSVSPTLRTLRDLPGPRALPVLGNTLQIDAQKFHLTLEDWAKQYGSIYAFKLGRKTAVVISDGELNNQIMRARPDTYRRVGNLEPIFREMGLQSVFSVEGEAWRQQRPLTVQSLSSQYQRNFFPTMTRIIERLRGLWANAAQQQSVVDVQKDLLRLTVDMTTNLTFGYDMNTLEHDGDVIQDHLEKVLPMIARRMTAPFPYWHYVKLPADRVVDHSLAEIHKFTQTFIAKARARMAENPQLHEQPTNFLEAMLAFAKVAATGEAAVHFSDADIEGNVFTMLLAGEETTAYTMAWMLHYMTLYPELQERMQREADQVLGNNRMLTELADADHLTYIEAVAHEAMRLRPPSPTFSMEPIVDVTVADVQIPRRTPIFLLARPPIWDEQNFTYATEFRPERWLADSRCPFHNEPNHAHNRSVHVPFGNGPRICPGRTLALLEIKTTMAMICRNFAVTPVNPDAQVGERFAFNMMPTGLAMRFTPRTAQ